MLWRLTLAVAVLYVGGICNCVRADELMSRLMVPRDYGVKLCGREFIRAVIFTCGGSRWKRSTEGDLDSFQWNSFSDVTLQDDKHTWQRSAELTESRPPPPPPPPPPHVAASSSYSLADLLTLYGTTGDRHPLSPSAPMEESQPSEFLGEQDGNLIPADWFIPSKKKRNFSLGVAGMCCNQGCTKNDIGRLC